ncbi:MAG TPA: Tm-1-like ATP-binding domain-containing protein [Xanthobacteraceae bacterium]|nr:Tm-1-like ATP-binding domain-containing protein [Xanthobacteraceae bacterium]
MVKTIALLATLDTKGVEVAFMRDCIVARGHRALVIDSGLIGEPATAADISNAQVAEAGGSSLEILRRHADREESAPVMAAGATKLVRELATRDEIHALVALGGTQGTTLSTAVMRALPYGFPKLMVSTMASGNVAPWVGTSDIVMMYSVTDIMGLNPFMRRVLANAAGAACGMAEVKPADTAAKPLVAITTVGITTVGAMKAAEVLQAAGYETITFHAVGTGGRAMEEMMRQGLIGAVLDYSTIEVSNEVFHALLAGGPDRLTTAGALGLPQVLCPGAIEVLVFNEPETVPERYRDRRLVRHSPQITDLRLNRNEMADVGREVGRRLRSTKDRAVFLIPKAGYDSYATHGEPFSDPEADAAFVDALRASVPASITIVESDRDINDPAFATEAAQTLIGLMQAKARSG